MQRFVEMGRLQKVGNTVKRIIVDENGTQAAPVRPRYCSGLRGKMLPRLVDLAYRSFSHFVFSCSPITMAMAFLSAQCRGGIYISIHSNKGNIRHLGLTNFDTEHLQMITESGIAIASNQIQYSIIDKRPEVKMIPFCKKHNISLLTYGTLCGGLLSEKYLGKPEPPISDLDTLSLQKYKKMIDKWGDWNLFQRLLLVLDSIAKKHKVSISNVAD